MALSCAPESDDARERIAESLFISAGEVRSGARTVYSVMRNEMFLLPAFLDHYRSLGVEQFLILSDRSDDGTTELIRSQPDCVLLGSTYAYGDWLDLPPGGPVRRRRAGVLMKAVIPRLYLADSVAIYVDADEFLILPPSMNSVIDLLAAMKDERVDAVYASMVEMYPEKLNSLRRSVPEPKTLGELLNIAPFFDDRPLVGLSGGATGPTIVGQSASSRLFRRFAIGERRRIFDSLPLPLRRLFTTKIYTDMVYKTPVVHFRVGVDLEGSHDVRGADSGTFLLSLLHFKFTPDSWRKAVRAVEEKSYSRKSLKYASYLQLFEEMSRNNVLFIYSRSSRYQGPDSLLPSGLVTEVKRRISGPS